ncbi:MAG: hypothetical protein PHS73_01290, partial [Candidatus Peribacteraceae bacterium]|nr:hypothetical protein [Candidatus Peribacteraceae bacterium]
METSSPYPMDRPSSLRPHTHSFESLETRQMLSGITGWDDVPLEQKDIAAAIADLMSKSGQSALDDEGLTTLRNELVQNDAFASILDTTRVFEKEQQEFGVANAKTKMMSDHITEETARKTRLGEELTQKSTLLAEAQTLLRSCESVESGLMTEQQRLTTLITDLRTELQQIPAQITALNQQITADQKKLNTTIRERRTAERSLLQCQTSYDRMIVLRDRYAGLLTQKPQNKTYQRAYEQTLKNMATYETRMQTYGMTIERCTATETDLNAALSANRGEVSHLKERRTALPAEIQSAKNQKTTVQAELTDNRAEQERLQTEIAGRQSAVDAAFAADAQAAAHLTQDESDLTALLAQEQAERADVEAIVAMVDNAIAQVLAEGDPPLPEIEEPEPAPVLLSESAHLAEGAVSSGMWTAELAGLGGTVTLQAWRGDAAPGTGIETIRGTDILQTVIASELTAQKLAANPTLASQLGIAAGPAPYQQGSGYAVEFVAEHPSESVGRVTVITDSPTSRNPRYILNTQGVLAPTRLGIDNKGKLVCSNVGQGAVSLVFPDGPQYVQWLDVRYLGGSVGGSILVTTASGEWKKICALGGSGAYIINETVQNLCILPTDDTSAYGLRSVEFARPQADTAEDAVWLRARGELVGIDLHNAGKAVSAVDLSLLSDRPGTRITAVAYRGETEVARADISADGTVHLEDVAGFTGVFLLKEGPSSVIAIRSMQVTGWDNTVAPAGDAPTIMNNRLVAEQNHPQWEHGTFNYIDVARQSGVHFSRGGYEDTVNGGVLHQPGSETSTTQYTRYDVRSMNGNVHFAGLYYIDADGLHRVPADRWTSMGSSLIVAPGGPKYLVLQIAGNGTYEIGSAVANRATDITPSQEMQLRSNVLVVRPIGPAEGFCTVPAGVSSENAHATAGGSVNMFYQILNDGLGSGPITVRIHVGQSGTAEDPVVKTFSGQNLAGMASIGLSVNVTLRAERDQVSMEVIGPDGQSTFVSKLVRPEHGGNGYTEEQRNIIMTEERGARYAARIDEYMRTSPDPRIVAINLAHQQEQIRIASLPSEKQGEILAEKER